MIYVGNTTQNSDAGLRESTSLHVMMSFENLFRARDRSHFDNSKRPCVGASLFKFKEGSGLSIVMDKYRDHSPPPGQQLSVQASALQLLPQLRFQTVTARGRLRRQGAVHRGGDRAAVGQAGDLVAAIAVGQSGPFRAADGGRL